MRLIYRGVKYSSNNSIALKIVREQKQTITQIIFNKKNITASTNRKFPWLQYIKQLFNRDSNFITNPAEYWHQNQADFLQGCWQVSEIEILKSCWRVTLEKEQKTVKTCLPIKYKYRGVTYYK